MYFGIVEDRNDPLHLGRVKVRIFGLHTQDKAMIPTETLPWASVMQPTTSAANSGVGQTTNLVEGTQVVVIFLDGHENMQDPFVMGTIPSINQQHLTEVDGKQIPRHDKGDGFQDPNNIYPKAGYINKSDIPLRAYGGFDSDQPRAQFKSSNALFSITEPEDIREKSKYPSNQVIRTESGHTIEYDNTPQNERISTQHKTGTFEEIRPDGTVVRKIIGDNYEIMTKDDNVFVKGNVNLHIDGNANTFIKNNWNINVGGDMRVKVDGNLVEDIKKSQTTNVQQDVIVDTVNGKIYLN